MPRYYFDIRDNRSFTVDGIGIEVATINDARLEAAKTLGEIAKEILAGLRSARSPLRSDLAAAPFQGPCRQDPGA
jgi:hypothetical protein